MDSVTHTVVKRIIEGNRQLSSFWYESRGWAPDDVADLMSKSRLDWQVSLSHTLKLWLKDVLTDGELILAWSNLGALLEGTLKLFLAVYYHDYKCDEDNFKKKNRRLIDPDALALEKLKQFFNKKNLLNDKQISLITQIQESRNAIHAFKHRPIGNIEEFHKCLSSYLDLMIEVNDRIPYPDDEIYKPRI